MVSLESQVSLRNGKTLTESNSGCCVLTVVDPHPLSKEFFLCHLFVVIKVQGIFVCVFAKDLFKGSVSCQHD